MGAGDRMMRGPISRRQLLRRGMALTGTLVGAGLLQACGSQQAPPNPPTQAPVKPTIIVGGLAVEGVRPYSTLRRVLEEAERRASTPDPLPG